MQRFERLEFQVIAFLRVVSELLAQRLELLQIRLLLLEFLSVAFLQVLLFVIFGLIRLSKLARHFGACFDISEFDFCKLRFVFLFG